MDHETAQLLLSEFVRGELDSAEASAVEKHMDSCRECSEAADLQRRIQEEVSTHGFGMFDDHPSSEDLARYALKDGFLAMKTWRG